MNALSLESLIQPFPSKNSIIIKRVLSFPPNMQNFPLNVIALLLLAVLFLRAFHNSMFTLSVSKS